MKFDDTILPVALTMPSFSPASKIPLRAEIGEAEALAVSWEFSLVSLGIGRDSDEYDDLFRSTVGSSYVAGDEFRFSCADGRFAAATLALPDTNLLSDVVFCWLSVPRTVGRLLLANPQGFCVDRVDGRRFSSRALIGINGDAVEPSADCLRLGVCHDFDLLFVEGTYVGWLLSNPLQHFIGGHGAASQAAGQLFEAYFQMITVDTVDRMTARDGAMLAAIQDLQSRAELLGCSHTVALREQLSSLVRRYYDL